MSGRPVIGLALGAGGARGFAHIGVLKVLEEERIPIDLIAGSSMGSFVGACYANGCRLSLMEGLAVHFKRKIWLDYKIPGMGFISGRRAHEVIRLLTHRKRIEEFPIPLAVVATDLASGEKVVFREGPAADAIRASISIPGVFDPVNIENRLLVDGGVVDRVPVSVVQEMGADLVIAVDVFAKVEQVKIRNIIDVIAQTLDIMERELLRRYTYQADVTIRPKVQDISSTAFTKVEECIRYGEEAAREQIPLVKKLIAEWRGDKKDV
ncbi:patatin-like phospholipase family protein [Baia soyae]|uniref:NTE family protein n=1 Tax=Baia soyae TaxID=1544746 RepID=A0A4R2S3P4_9BACL|nr:patatin-like phospholipase family protein [Baia soyae]TCP70654.1 NTE family protein [Baia soyae]